MRLWQERSFLEQALLLLLLCLLVVIMGLSITVGVRNKHGWGCPLAENTAAVTDKTNQSGECNNLTDIRTYCLTTECMEVASDLLTSMGNDDTNPCDDFYQFACNGWLSKAQFKNKERAVAEKLRLRIEDLLEEDFGDQSIPDHFQLSKSYFSGCVNWVTREQDGVRRFLDDLENFGGFPAFTGDQWNASSFNYLSALVRMGERGFRTGSLISVQVKPDFRNTSRLVIALGAPDLGFTPPDLLEHPVMQYLFTEYLELFTSYLCGEKKNDSLCNTYDDDDNTTNEMEETIEVHRRLAQIAASAYSLDSGDANKTVIKLGDLQNEAKEVDWLTLVRLHLSNFHSVDPEQEVVLDIPLTSLRNLSLYLKQLDSSEQGRRSLANYLAWRSILEAAPDLNQRTRMMFYNMWSYMDGQMLEPDLRRQCLLDTRRRFRYSVTGTYVNRFNPGFFITTKSPVESLIRQIRRKIKTTINETFWLDDVARKLAIDKLDKLHVAVGYPEGLENDQKLNVYYKKMMVGDIHYENVRNSNIFLKSKVLEKLGKVTDRFDWEWFPEDLLGPSSAVYINENNSAYIPLTLTENPFFDENFPMYVNLARLGTVIGQLLSRAIDAEGSFFDAKGNRKNWWKENTRSKFAFKSQCVFKMMETSPAPQRNMSVLSRKLLLRSLAADTGLRQAYKALKEDLENGYLPEKLPGLELGTKQFFWISYASMMCEKPSAKLLQKEGQFSTESPASIRVNGPLSMNKNFVRDFHCPKDSRMRSKEERCVIWGN